MRKVSFWFDFSSPYAYLASTRIEGIAARTGAELTWRPMLLGALFRQIGQADAPLLAASPAKQRWYHEDLRRWADWWQVPFTFPSRFPIRTVLPLRVFLASGDPALAHRIFRATWAEDRDPGDPEVLRSLGVTDALLDAAPAQKLALFQATAEAEARGVFGTPTFLVDDRWLFWGQDRLDMLERCLGGWDPPG